MNMERHGERLGRRFYERDARSLAPALLGQRVVRVRGDGQRVSGMIVEAEAYIGVEDRASHAFGGRRTARNESMYAQAGSAYVYFTYGMHWMLNVVCGRVDEPAAVLIRALEPLEGLEFMRQARGARTPGGRVRRDIDLCRGPACLCAALSIDRSLDSVDLVKDRSIFLESGTQTPPDRIEVGPRVGVESSGTWASAPLRYWVAGHPCVSGRPSQTGCSPPADTLGSVVRIGVVTKGREGR